LRLSEQHWSKASSDLLALANSASSDFYSVEFGIIAGTAGITDSEQLLELLELQIRNNCWNTPPVQIQRGSNSVWGWFKGTYDFGNTHMMNIIL